MKILRFAAAVVLLASAGCMKVREELLILPDGSGRLTFSFSVQSKGDAARFTQAEMMSGDPDEILEKVRGVAALARPSMTEKDGLVTIRMTAYFDDVNALKFMDDGEGAKAKPKEEFVFRRDGETATLEVKGNLLADEMPERAPADPELLKQREELFKAMFSGFEFRLEVKLPGNVTMAEGFQGKEGRVASYTVAERDLQKPADQQKLNAAVKFRASCGKSEVSDAEAADFRKELESAKAAWAELRQEMKKRSEKK